VRFVGNPATRIAEDYLRILRLFRFHAGYGEGALDPAGLAASIAAREGLATLSRERVRAELMKLLVARGAVATLQTMADAGILQAILGGVPLVASFAAMIELEREMKLPVDPVRGLAALAVLVTEDADRLMQRLRLSNVEYTRLSSMADRWWQIAPHIGEAGARALLYRLKPDTYADRILLAWSRSGAKANAAAWRELMTLPQRWIAPAFPLKAADFLAQGVEKGPKLGAILAQAERAWISAGFPSDPAVLEKLVAQTLQGS
jgi:tRNA nucleotidyltransferase/poly(A) polymerase